MGGSLTSKPNEPSLSKRLKVNGSPKDSEFHSNIKIIEAQLWKTNIIISLNNKSCKNIYIYIYLINLAEYWIYTYIHTYINTYIFIYIYIYINSSNSNLVSIYKHSIFVLILQLFIYIYIYIYNY